MTGARPRIAVLASGRGSNFDAILRATRDGRLDADIVAVVSDKADAPVLEKAKAAGIPAVLVPWSKDIAGLSMQERRERHDERIIAMLAPHSPTFLVLAGYMRLVSPKLLEAFRSERGYSRLVNIHPSLLPAFPGVNSYAQAFEYGAQVTGVTVHLVDLEMDSGPICAQEAFSIRDCRNVEEVEARGLAIEHRLYPEALRWVLREEFDIEVRTSRRFCVRPR